MRVILLSLFAIAISAMGPNGNEQSREPLSYSDGNNGLFGGIKNRFGTTAALAEAKQVLRDAQLQADDLISKAQAEAARTMSQASNQASHLQSEIKQLQQVAERISLVESAKAKSKTGFPICVRWEQAMSYGDNGKQYIDNGYEPIALGGNNGYHILYRKCVSYA
ncbi:hypothetical protein MP228_005113 [Amoeboaphelidium protococcarum]|nr:hypothetical protein MP228_005113 [Amoeboaphelidium protococcarum]